MQIIFLDKNFYYINPDFTLQILKFKLKESIHIVIIVKKLFNLLIIKNNGSYLWMMHLPEYRVLQV